MFGFGQAMPIVCPTSPNSFCAYLDWSDVEEDWGGEKQNEEEREKSRKHKEEKLKELKQKCITGSLLV